MASILLRLPEVLRRRGNLSKSSHYADIQNGLFTKPVKIGERASAWPYYEEESIAAFRIAGKTKTEIRALVRALHAARISGKSEDEVRDLVRELLAAQGTSSE